MTRSYSCQEKRNDKPKICTEIVPINGQQSLGDNNSEADRIGMGAIQHSRACFQWGLSGDNTKQRKQAASCG
jgi:hypothetical protein